MTGTSGKRLQFRITVMLGNTDTDRTALDMLNLLAAETKGEILGLFMEDIELLSLAELPVAREYCRLTHVERQLNSADLERQLRVQARSSQQALAAIAERIGFKWTFQTVRGSLANLVQSALADVDVMLLGAARRTLPLSGQVPSAPLPRPDSRPVSLIYDGSEAAQRALAVALRIAQSSRQALKIFLVAADAGEFVSLREQITALDPPVALNFHELVDPDIGEILAAARRERTCTLVLGMNERFVSPESVEQIRNHLRCPSILVK